MNFLNCSQLPRQSLAFQSIAVDHAKIASEGKKILNKVILESFVQVDRFAGTCYRAANWIEVGRTQGRTRQDRYTTIQAPIKAVYLYPLDPKARQRLCHEEP